MYRLRRFSVVILSQCLLKLSSTSVSLIQLSRWPMSMMLNSVPDSWPKPPWETCWVPRRWVKCLVNVTPLPVYVPWVEVNINLSSDLRKSARRGNRSMGCESGEGGDQGHPSTSSTHEKYGCGGWSCQKSACRHHCCSRREGCKRVSLLRSSYYLFSIFLFQFSISLSIFFFFQMSSNSR